MAAKPPSSLRIIAGVPARYGSTRFPGKPLASICGRPMIEHVYQRAAACPLVSQVIVATDDPRIAAAVEAFGGTARLTRPDHASGTDRLAEVFDSVECDLVVNIQGDEPLLDPQAIAQAIEPFFAEPSLQVSTLKTRIGNRETLLSPHVVKVVTNADGFAVNFSRRPDPPVGPEERVDLKRTAYFKHPGLYVYTRAFLLRFPQLPQTAREREERLEQLRILEHGIPIRVVETSYDPIGVDTPEDLAEAEAAMRRAAGVIDAG